VLWGVAPDAHTGSNRRDALVAFESRTGRRQNIMHAYHRGRQLFPTEEEIALARDPAGARLLFLNWKPTGASWAAIAAGDHATDTFLDRLAAHIRSTFTEQFFFTIHHEPENDVVAWRGSGYTATDYAAMFRYVVTRLRHHGVPNLVTVMSYMAYPRWATQRWFEQLYPGDGVVDWIAWDTYAHSNPGGYGYGDFAEMVERRSSTAQWPGFYTWATRRFPTKPLMLGEWGAYYDSHDPSHQAYVFLSAALQIASFPRVKSMVYFDTPNLPGRITAVSATPLSLAAYRLLGRQPAFQVSVDRQPASAPAGPPTDPPTRRPAAPRARGTPQWPI
jgi:hypothetical protein